MKATPWIFLAVVGQARHLGLEAHAAFGAVARMVLPDLRMHRAGVDGAGGRRGGCRGRGGMVVAMPVVALVICVIRVRGTARVVHPNSPSKNGSVSLDIV